MVNDADLEGALAGLASGVPDPAAGIFGPASVLWQIDREAAVFLGAGRATLLQLAHPWVAAAIAEHSTTLDDPIGRFHRTFEIVFTMVFGTLEEAAAAARRLYRRHAEITGTLAAAAGPFPAGSAYAANDVAALQWVHATLIDTALLAHDLVLPPLEDDARERYWAEAQRFAALFGIPVAAVPASWGEFAAATERTLNSRLLVVTDAARAIAAVLFRRRLAMPFWYRALTARLLPPRLRAAYGMPYGEAEARAAERALRVLRRLYPRLPVRLRYVGPYQEAAARLAGRDRPGPWVGLLNLLWIGRARMPSP